MLRTKIPFAPSLLAFACLTACGAGSGGLRYVDNPPHAQVDDAAAEDYGDGMAPEERAPSVAPPPSDAVADEAGEPEPMSEPAAGAPALRREDVFRESPRPRRRPGLATTWGERRRSRVSSASFVRADRSQPFAMASLFYNDADGIDAMTAARSVQRGFRTFPVGRGHVALGLRDQTGRFMTGLRAGGDNYVEAYAGRRYTIVVDNQSPGRVEAVLSVDGLDVIDGEAASPNKRGYLIEPYTQLEVEGFRTSTSEVASFRFGSVGASYANRKHGTTRNVGVIGLAVFHERGDDHPSFWGPPRGRDADRRHRADPFPQRFAAPPGR